MQPSHSIDPQIGPALALVALRSEFPHLPAAKWQIDRDGHLMATVYDPETFEAYAGVLGGTPMGPMQRVDDGVVRESNQLFATWRGVEVSLWSRYIVGTVPTVQAVAA